MGRGDPYRLLGIGPDASTEQVRAAFRKKVREQHPDTAAIDARAEPPVDEVIEAYRLLSDPESRARYDAASRARRDDPGPGARRIEVRRGAARHDPFPASPTSQARTRRCGACGGRGRERAETICPSCRGHAEITALDASRARIVVCRRCGGRGTMIVSRSCPSCSGTGV